MPWSKIARNSISTIQGISPRVSGADLRNPPSTFLSTFSALRSLSPLPAHRPRLYQHTLEPLRVLIICHSVTPCRVIAADPLVPCYTPYPTCPATGTLHALHLSLTRIPPFHHYWFSYRCVAGSPPLRRASHRHLSAYRCIARSPPLGRATLLSIAICLATGALHALHLSQMRTPPFHCYLSAYRCVACSPPLSNVHLPFSPPSVRLQVSFMLSTPL